MDFNDTPQEAAFRAEARAFLDAVAPRKQEPNQTWASIVEDKSTDNILCLAKEYQQKKYEGGWACLHWPKAYGGRESTPIERVIWGEEEANYLVPRGVFEIGQGMCGPTVMAYASEEQKERYLPPLASGEEIWCQLFSEPGAGSDLAQLRTKAEKDGDDWVINGQKIWTSGAHYSDYGIVVVRTDPTVAKHKGMSFFFLDMKSPGVEVRPIKQISGGSHFNEVFFTDVRIPDAQRLGDVGAGWRVAITTLMNERVSVGDAPGPDVEQLMDVARKVQLGAKGRPAIENDMVRERIADWHCQAAGLKYTKYRTLSALSRGATPGPESSITKLVSASKLQDISTFGMELMEMGGTLVDGADVLAEGAFQANYMSSTAYRIAGGSDEILRNIIGERVLGLPQEPRVDKGIPFNEVPTGSANG